MLMQDEQYVIKWLSQYGALKHRQVVQLLNKPDAVAEKIIRNLKRWNYITDLPDGYLSTDPTYEPDKKVIEAMWVLLKYRYEVAPMEHFPATYPSQIFFLKQQTGYEIVVLGPGEEHLLRLLQPEDDLKYIILLPDVEMAQGLRLPPAPCLLTTARYTPGLDEPRIVFYDGGHRNGTDSI